MSPAVLLTLVSAIKSMGVCAVTACNETKILYLKCHSL
jgi:hypothetical protein